MVQVHNQLKKKCLSKTRLEEGIINLVLELNQQNTWLKHQPLGRTTNQSWLVFTAYSCRGAASVLVLEVIHGAR